MASRHYQKGLKSFAIMVLGALTFGLWGAFLILPIAVERELAIAMFHFRFSRLDQFLIAIAVFLVLACGIYWLRYGSGKSE